MSSDYECGECSSRGLNFLALVALFALVTLVIAYLVAQTLKKKVGEKGKDDASILKVALNYLQMASFAAVVDFRWPEFMRDTIMATSAVSTPRSVVLAADCLLQRSAGKGSRAPGCCPPCAHSVSGSLTFLFGPAASCNNNMLTESETLTNHQHLG